MSHALSYQRPRRKMLFSNPSFLQHLQTLIIGIPQACDGLGANRSLGFFSNKGLLFISNFNQIFKNLNSALLYMYSLKVMVSVLAGSDIKTNSVISFFLLMYFHITLLWDNVRQCVFTNTYCL